ncbi:hypothetical protein EES45_20680 [Streptomyces sp. ADI97-07]|nr:hypothetical protein EES45_20680 [Streptomyces sp. ADI97-07]
MLNRPLTTFGHSELPGYVELTPMFWFSLTTASWTRELYVPSISPPS